MHKLRSLQINKIISVLCVFVILFSIISSTSFSQQTLLNEENEFIRTQEIAIYTLRLYNKNCDKFQSFDKVFDAIWSGTKKKEGDKLDIVDKYFYLAKVIKLIDRGLSNSDYITVANYKKTLMALYSLLSIEYDVEEIDFIFCGYDDEDYITVDDLNRIMSRAQKYYPILHISSGRIFVDIEAADKFQQDIKKIFDDTMKVYRLEGEYGISVTDLETGYNFSVNENLTEYDPATNSEDAYFEAASVIKLPLFIAIIDMVEKGEIDLKNFEYDEFIGRKINWETGLYNLIAYSDNNMYNSSLRLLGSDRLNAKFHELGMKHMNMYAEIGPAIKASAKRNRRVYGTNKGGVINPRGMEVAMEYVHTKYPEAPLMKILKQALEDSSIHGHGSRIPQGVTENEVVLHKTGTVPWVGIYGDCGIVYGKHPFTVNLLTNNEVSEYRFTKFAIMFTEKLNKYFNYPE